MIPACRLLVYVLPALLLLVGCTSPAAPPDATADAPRQDLAERDAVLDALQTMNQDTLRNAFAGLDRYSYTRYTRTEQREAARQHTASTETTTRIDRRDGQRTHIILQADSTGTFDAGALGGFVHADPDQRDAASLPDYVLLDDPPYLAPRNREAFLYRFLPDTVFWGNPTQVIEVRAHPSHGASQSIRRARFYLDRASNALIGIYLERTEDAMFFDEASRFSLRLRPAPGGGWAPFTLRLRTRLDLPLRPSRSIHTVSAYYSYEPAGL